MTSDAHRVSIKEVAKKAGVSIAAVSRALNNSGYVGVATREKVEEAIKELGYRPNALARGLVRNESRTIGLCLPYLTTPFISSLMEGVEAESNKYGYDVFMCHTREDPNAEKNAMMRMLSRQVDGIIAVPVIGDTHYIEEITETVPTMLLLRKPKGMERNLIRIADYQGARQSFSLLLEKGHRDIGVIGGSENVSTIRERWRGIRDLCEERGISLDASRTVETKFAYQDSYLAAKRMLESDKRPTAIYAMHYWASTALIRVLLEMGLKPPDDISVVAYESFEDWNLMSPLRLATNIFRADKFGSAAVEKLHQLIAGKQLFMPENIEIEQTFYPYDSVMDVN